MSKPLERNQTWDAILDNNYFGVWDWPDVSQKKNLWSPSMYQILGLNESTCEPNVDTFFDCVHPEDKEVISEKLEDHFTNGTPFKVQYRIILPNGEIKWIEGSGRSYIDSSTGAKAMTGIVLDITIRKSIELDRERHLELLYSAERAAKLASFQWKIDEEEFEFSKGGQVLFGFESERISLQAFLDIIIEEERDYVYKKLKYDFTSDEELSFEFTLMPVDSSIEFRTIKCYYDPKMDLELGKSSFYGTFRDISISKKKSIEIETLLDDLKRSNSQLEEFAYVASHDLQEPLRKIQTFGERLMIKSNNLSERDQSYIERMNQAAGRMQQLVKDLLEFSRIGRRESVGEEFQLSEVIDTVIQDLQVNIEETQAEIVVGKLPKIYGAKDQIYRVFLNLFSNSLKFRSPDRKPSIEVSSRKAKKSEVKGWQTISGIAYSQYYKITISDNGIGFEEEYLEKIFTIFQRLHSKEEYKGTGIGLAIVKKIIENHGGHITAEGSPGQGATFIIFLPLQ
ncbi:PAS domain-containing sensor histidine kinase [Sanyastnella coralliicola]|uniref:PAS domain-containing sensor histidine kinase n=1 Tax=Sanyastnella coralliicola TaxID=3069118 RepID=UPI0027BAE277|nr:ATP-binding protein [Longitalea sp. SCSIO 12813]